MLISPFLFITPANSDDDNWRNIHEPIKEEDKVADNVEDKVSLIRLL